MTTKTPQISHGGEREYVRFNVKARLLHLFMIISFIGLGSSGMILKFSYAPWASFLAHLVGGFQVAGRIHRSCAVIIFIVFFTHLADLFTVKKKYGGWIPMLLGPNSMVPLWDDAKQLVASLKWFVGAGPKPNYGRYTYWEKFDYFAVFWGMTIIGSTGLMLWFPTFFTRFLPGQVINIATIVHSDEALLAVGFIFTIHFFNTHLRPEKFPMDTTIFTGHMKMEEFKRDKPAEYEAMVKSGKLEENMAPPPGAGLMFAIRSFAWLALLAGVSLIVAILYAMIFVHPE